MQDQQRTLRAALWMAGSIAGFSLVAVSARALSVALDSFEIMFYRSLVGIVAVTSVALATGQRDALRPRLLPLHLRRNLIHFAGQVSWLHALTLIPLAQLFALEFSYPIIVALAAPMLLGERLTGARLAAAAAGFAGILIVTRPFGTASLSPGLVAALLSAVGFAGAAIVTKQLTRVTSITAILFWLTVIQAGLGLLSAGLDGQIALPHGMLAAWVLVIGLGGLGAHLCLTTALALAPASVVTPMDFLRLPLIAVVGMLLYGEPLDPWVFAGGAVILAGNWINIRADAPKRP